MADVPSNKRLHHNIVSLFTTMAAYDDKTCVYQNKLLYSLSQVWLPTVKTGSGHSFMHYTVHCLTATTRWRRQKEMKRISALLISLKVLKFFSNGSDPVLAMKQLGAVMLFLCLLRMAFTSPAIQVEDGRYLDQEVIQTRTRVKRHTLIEYILFVNFMVIIFSY
jgi:hypothetical protein